ncbi:DNA-binding protein [Chryseobacterium sp. RG1]|uniref:DNA-binding protein n=1 Tax=Chryseobacterium tagetis TaxID=2801334 RepID=A0ABS8A5C7_9FLAO|nr:DNA-binding protein [Chryseobacterium tagetis]MCA6069186.1 DNA-binding protein [Chryseobacterium tagetis]
MPIKFKTQQKKNPRDLNAPAKWYASTIGDGETTFSDLAQYASEVSTVSKADILAVLESCFTKVTKDLSDGKIVRVGEYFTLQMSISSDPADTEAEVTAAKIRKSKINFRPGKMLSDMIKLATYQKK